MPFNQQSILTKSQELPARANRIRVWQEDFPYGMIFIQNPSAHGYVDQKPAPPEPVVAERKKPIPPKRKPKMEAMQNAQN